MSKKILVLVLVLLAFGSIGAFAQVYVGGTLGFEHTSQDNGFTTASGNYFWLGPSVGYRLNEQLSIGGDLYLGIGDTGSYEDAMILGIGAFVRYAFLQLGDLDLLIKGQAYYQNTSADALRDNINYLAIGVSPQAEYYFSDLISIYANIGWVGFERTWVGDVNSNTFGLDLSSENIGLGFYIHF